MVMGFTLMSVILVKVSIASLTLKRSTYISESISIKSREYTTLRKITLVYTKDSLLLEKHGMVDCFFFGVPKRKTTKLLVDLQNDCRIVHEDERLRLSLQHFPRSVIIDNQSRPKVNKERRCNFSVILTLFRAQKFTSVWNNSSLISAIFINRVIVFKDFHWQNIRITC